MKLTSSPNLSASMRQSGVHGELGLGIHDRVFILGHADGIDLNTPYPIIDPRKAFDAMDNDEDSPLIAGVLEALSAGAKDVWIMAVAPMSEYKPLIEDRDAAYYTTYKNRLDTAYDVLKHYENAQITVPIDAPFNSSVDFLTPLVNYCKDAFALTGEIHLGIMGTRGQISQSTINAMIADGRLNSYGEDAKFVGIFAGDVSFNFRELKTRRTASAAVSVAALMSQLPLDRGVTYQKLRNAITVAGYTPTDAEINSMSEAGINYVGLTSAGRRNVPFNVIPFSDNTLAADGSDYWSFVQMRLVSQVSINIRSLGKRYLGTIGYGIFRNDCERYMNRLTESRVIRGYDMVIQRDPKDKTQVFVELSIKPYFGIRDIVVDIVAGPQVGG